MCKFRELIDAFSLSGAIILFLVSLTMIGIAMDWAGKPNGEKVWSTFGASFTAFVAGRHITPKKEPEDEKGA
jgi:hypothetical protein